MPRSPEPLGRRLLWVLVALCLATFAALAPHLVYPDLNLDYPFVDGDSHDWIANGLFLAGHDVRYSGRPPLLPLILALLDRLGLLRWWPVLGLSFFLATIVGFYTLAARLFPAAAAFAAALLLLADYSLQSLALDLMADVPASCLLLWSARAFLTARAREAAPAGQPGAAATPSERAVGAGQPGATPGARAATGAAERPHRYVWSGLLAGLSALTQPMCLLLPLAAGATLAARRRRDLATRWPWIGAALVIGCEGLWMAVGRFSFAPRGDSLKDPWRLVGFHLSTVGSYLWSLVSLLGMPACLLLAAGVLLAGWRAWRGRDPEPAAASLFALLLFLSLVGFVVFWYRWEAKRFLVYAVWPAGLLIAEALSPLARMASRAGRMGLGSGAAEQRAPRPAAATRQAATGPAAMRPAANGHAAVSRLSMRSLPIVAVSALAIGGAALPLPQPGRDGTWAVVSPLPPLAAHLVVDNGPGGAVADDAGNRSDHSDGNDRSDRGKAARSAPLPSSSPPFSVIPLAPADLAHLSTFGRAARAWAERPSPAPRRPSPALFAAADSALYLFDRPEDGGGRYRTLTRLSNALRKPVRFVPRATLAPYWALLTVSPLARIAPDYDVYQVTLPGIAGTWLLVTPGDRPLDPRHLNHAGAGTQAAGLARAAAEATAIAAWTGRGYAYVALFPSPDGSDPADLYLLFLLRSTELYVIEPSAAATTRALLGRSPVESERQFGSARALATRVRGQRTAVVIFGR